MPNAWLMRYAADADVEMESALWAMSPEGALESHEGHDYTVEEPHDIDWRVSTPAKAYDNLPQWRQKIGL